MSKETDILSLLKTGFLEKGYIDLEWLGLFVKSKLETDSNFFGTAMGNRLLELMLTVTPKVVITEDLIHNIVVADIDKIISQSTTIPKPFLFDVLSKHGEELVRAMERLRRGARF